MLLDLTEVPSIDFTTSRALEDIIIDTVNAVRHIFLVGARAAVCDMLEKQNVLRHFDIGHMYLSRMDALLHAKHLLKM